MPNSLYLEGNISYEESQAIRNAMPRIDSEDEYSVFEHSSKYGEALKEFLSDKNLDLLEKFSKTPATSVLIMRGFPVEASLRPTPCKEDSYMTQIPLTSAINVALYDAMNIFPVTYQGENNGRLFRDIVPKNTGLKEKSSYGSSQTLGMHVDNCHLPLVPERNRSNLSLAPEYLSLYSLRCDLRVATQVAFLDKALEKLDDITIETLKLPLYELSMPDSFSSNETFTLPVLVEDEDGTYYARFDKEYTRPLTEEAKTAFERLEEVLAMPDVVNRMFLLPGDFLIFKNQRVTHARGAFQARFDGTDRWMVRLFGVNSPNRMIAVDENNPHVVKAG